MCLFEGTSDLVLRPRTWNKKLSTKLKNVPNSSNVTRFPSSKNTNILKSHDLTLKLDRYPIKLEPPNYV